MVKRVDPSSDASPSTFKAQSTYSSWDAAWGISLPAGAESINFTKGQTVTVSWGTTGYVVSGS